MKSDQIDPETAALTNVLAPTLDPIAPAPLREQIVRAHLEARVAHSVAIHADFEVHRRNHGQWQQIKSGVTMKLLKKDTAGNSVLVRLAPGASLPVHRHRWAEEGIVVEGAVFVGCEQLSRGDYHLSLPGSRHELITAPQGATTFLRGASLGGHGVVLELLSGLLPHRGLPPVTQRLEQGTWTTLAAGVQQHVVRSDGARSSRMIRMASGSSVPDQHLSHNEECMMIEGDAFFGDLLVCAGDYHFAPGGSTRGRVGSDEGALMFVHGECGS
jgi:anti-sigma factor ChrR (cupin superfamily)